MCETLCTRCSLTFCLWVLCVLWKDLGFTPEVWHYGIRHTGSIRAPAVSVTPSRCPWNSHKSCNIDSQQKELANSQQPYVIFESKRRIKFKFLTIDSRPVYLINTIQHLCWRDGRFGSAPIPIQHMWSKQYLQKHGLWENVRFGISTQKSRLKIIKLNTNELTSHGKKTDNSGMWFLYITFLSFSTFLKLW